MSASQLYQELNKEIKDSVSKAEQFYKSLSIQSVPMNDLSSYKIELGSDHDAYNQQVWQYFEARYADQTKLKRYYFDLEKKLMDKKSILQDQLTQLSSEYENYKTDNQVAISSIKNDKYEIEKNKRDAKIMVGIMLCLVFLIFIVVLNIFGLLPANISLFIGVATVLGLILTLGYLWYYESNRSNSVWDLRNYDVNNSNSSNQQCAGNPNNLAVMDSQANAKKDIDTKVQNIIKNNS